MDMKVLSLLSLLVAYQSGLIEAEFSNAFLQNFPMGNYIFVPNFTVQISNENIKYQKITNSVNKCRNMCLVIPECELVSIKNDKTNGQVNCTIFTNGIFKNKIYAETDSYLFQRLKTVYTMIGDGTNQVRKAFHVVDEAVYDPERGKFLMLHYDEKNPYDSANAGCSGLSEIVKIKLALIHSQYQLEMFQHLVSGPSFQDGKVYQFWMKITDFFKVSSLQTGNTFGLDVNSNVIMLPKDQNLSMICQSKPFHK